MAAKVWLVFAAALCFSSAVFAEAKNEHRNLGDIDDGRKQDEFSEYDEHEDNSDKDDRKCPAVNLPAMFGSTCDVTDYCSKITCTAREQDKTLTIVFQVNRCEEPVTATVTFKAPDYDEEWSHTFSDGEEIEIPHNLGLSTNQIPASKMVNIIKFSIKVGLKKTGDKVEFKLELLGQVKFMMGFTRDLDATILEGKLPLETDHCGFESWFKKQPTYVQALLIGGAVVTFVIIVTLIYCCCCKRPRRGEPARTNFTVQLPGHRTTESNVSMQPLINEV